uniref:Uncharacterized protein n=1 Tax=Anopheles stephensi TaxID=30069 RepID=A0A182Y891_ANOST
MCSSIPAGGNSIAFLMVLSFSGLLFSCVVGDLPAIDAESPKSIPTTANEQQIPEPQQDSFLNTEPSSPYQMVAHSDYNNRLLIQPLKQPHGTPSFVTSLLPTVPPARKRSTTDNPRRTRYSPAAPTKDEDLPNRSLLTPSRYYDSYGEWHHDGGAVDPSHWATQQPHGGGNWDWKPHSHQHHHHPHQHHGNVLAEILDSTALYPPYHLSQQQQQQQHGLLGLQLFVLLHPVLMLGTVSFLMCLVNAVLGLVDKVKLPIVRAQDVDRISAGSTTPAGLRDGRGELLLDQLYQYFKIAVDQQQQNQRNDTYLLEKAAVFQELIRK